MTWRRFLTLVGGLSMGATFRVWMRHRPKAPLEGEALERAFSKI